MNIAAMEQEALLHLRRSIGTSAGMHKAALRKRVAALQPLKPDDCVRCGKDICNEHGWCNDYLSVRESARHALCHTT
jgi:hypothetical protein